MKLTDKEAIKALKRVRSLDIEDLLHDYTEDEREGRTDWEMIAHATGVVANLWDEYETSFHDDLEDAYDVIAEKHLYKEYEVKKARDTINEYNRVVRFAHKLKGMGLYVPYF